MKVMLSCLLLLCLATSMAVAAPDPAKALEQQIALDASGLSVADALKPAADKLGMPILVDDSIKDKVTATLGEMPISKMLNTLCNSRKWTWRVAYLPATGASVSQVDAAMATARTMRSASAIIQDPATNKTTVVLANPSPEKVKLAEIAEALGLKPAIVISAPRVEAVVVGDVKSDPNRVESRLGPPKGSGRVVSGAPPSGRVGSVSAPQADVQSMAKQMITTFQNLPPDQQMQLMREIRQQMGGGGGPGGGGGGGNWGGGGRRGGNHGNNGNNGN